MLLLQEIPFNSNTQTTTTHTIFWLRKKSLYVLTTAKNHICKVTFNIGIINTIHSYIIYINICNTFIHLNVKKL